MFTHNKTSLERPSLELVLALFWWNLSVQRVFGEPLWQKHPPLRAAKTCSALQARSCPRLGSTEVMNKFTTCRRNSLYFFFLLHCAEKPAGGCSRWGNLGSFLALGSVSAAVCACKRAHRASCLVTHLACSCAGSRVSSRQQKSTIPTSAVLALLAFTVFCLFPQSFCCFRVFLSLKEKKKIKKTS